MAAGDQCQNGCDREAGNEGVFCHTEINPAQAVFVT